MEKVSTDCRECVTLFFTTCCSKCFGHCVSTGTRLFFQDDSKLYSKTHKKVGVIFGTIVNFNELYEESFEGGKEFLRFLSELISK